MALAGPDYWTARTVGYRVRRFGICFAADDESRRRRRSQNRLEQPFVLTRKRWRPSRLTLPYYPQTSTRQSLFLWTGLRAERHVHRFVDFSPPRE